MLGGIFDYDDPMQGAETSFEGAPLLEVLLSEFGWTQDNIGPVYHRFLLDEIRGPEKPKPVIRPSRFARDGLTETVSLKQLLKPRSLLPHRGIMFTSDPVDYDGNEHIPDLLEEWSQIFEESLEVYPCKGKSRHVVPDRWYGIVRVDFPDLYLADQLDLPAREYSIPLRILSNPDNIKIATGEFEACRDRARRINDWIYHKRFVW